MGTAIYTDGELEIQPPLPWPTVREFVGHAHRNDPAAIVVHGEETETREGTLTRKTGTAIMPRFASSTRNDSGLINSIQAIVNAAGPAHRFLGYLECSSEEPGTMPWRIYVIDGTVHRVDPVVRWVLPNSRDGEFVD